MELNPWSLVTDLMGEVREESFQEASRVLVETTKPMEETPTMICYWFFLLSCLFYKDAKEGGNTGPRHTCGLHSHARAEDTSPKGRGPSPGWGLLAISFSPPRGHLQELTGK